MAIGLGVNIQKQPNKAPTGALGEAIVNGSYPKLLLDFNDDYYATNGGKKLLGEALTHSRSGNATMVASDGLIKWAPHNLLRYSQEFDNAAWALDNSSATNPVVTSNSGVAPNGTLTADRIQLDKTGGVFSRIQQASGLSSLPNGLYTFSVWLKNNAAGSVNVGIRIFDVGVNCVVTNEWQLFSASLSAAGTNAQAQILLFDSIAGNDETADILAWGAHLYRSDLGGMAPVPAGERVIPSASTYVPTTSSARYLPRVGHHVYNGSAWVNEGLLHESEARTNLVTYSEDFRNTADAGSTRLWAYNVVSITPNTVASVSGETTADTLTASVAGTAGTFLAYVATPTGENTFSVFLKKGTHRYYQILNSGDAQAFANFDVEAGLVGTHGTDVIPVIEDFGNGWYRCAVRFLSGTSYGASFRVYFVSSASDPFGLAFTSTGTETAYIYGAQLEAAPTPSSYIPTAGATVTRAAETLTIPSANLPWPTETYGPELVTNGTFDTDTDWTKGTGWTISAGVATHNGAFGQLEQTVSGISGKTYILTGEATYISGGQIELRVNGSLLQSISLASGSFNVTFVSDGSDLIQFGAGSGIWNLDNISVRELTRYPVSIQMNGRLSYADEGSAGQVTYAKWEANANNRIALTLDTDSTATGEVNFTQVNSGTADTVTSSATEYSPGILVPYNIASRHGMTFINGAVDGVALTADTTPTALPDLSSTDLNLAYDYMGTIKTFRIWDKDLGDTGIEEATAPSLEPSLELVFDGSESSFVVLDWEN